MQLKISVNILTSRAIQAGLLVWHSALRVGFWKIGAAVLGLLLGINAAGHLFGATKAEQAATDVRTVSVRTVADLVNEGEPLSVAGTVSSKSEASVLVQKTGGVVGVYHQLGDYVSAGSIIAEIDSASERAALAQAQGLLDAARASGGISDTSLAAAQSGAVNTLLATYAIVDNAVRGGIDPMFSNPETVYPQFSVLSSNSQVKIDIENGRVALSPLLAREQARATTLVNTDELAAELAATAGEVRVVRDFLDQVIITLNNGIPANNISAATIASYKATASAARSAVTAALSSLTGAQQTLTTAEQNATGGAAMSSSAGALLAQAQAGLKAAEINLEKTLIRASIAGTINSLSLKRGDFVQAFTPAASIANNNALEVVLYVTEGDSRNIRVGAKAIVHAGNGATLNGTITRIAPALDPLTKKIEVRVAVADEAHLLINGQSVLLAIARTLATPTSATSLPIIIPIAALKIGADGTKIFTVSASSSAVAHSVTIGALLGDKVTIKEGLTLDMEIVTDARGLQDGERVLVL
ncbi:efflux RND transporter periplasmic adaptor subunit [Patescibacteria group bacterium]|nr:efflux RND transporter periplasmic adaptor subunit [Patescibacteria group bacterium]